MKEEVLSRFLKYVAVHTRSDASSKTVPSSMIQKDLAKILVDELDELGMSDIHMDQYGIVTALLPGNIGKEVKTIGFLAHMDTADFEAEHVHPIIIDNYDGQDIILNEKLDIVTHVDDFPFMKDLKGKTLVVTDGTTLLGADNKAGIAAIMTAMHHLIQHPEIKHGDIKVGFTIDEEIGTGADYFDVEGFGADFAYTIDGGELGGLEYETFNAASASIKFHGVSVHPGTAKDTLVNAAILAQEYFDKLPHQDRPEHTEGYEGFFLLLHLTGNIEEANMLVVVRDHDREKFEARKKLLLEIAKDMNESYGYEAVEVTMSDTYYNMREIIEKDMRPVELAEKAMSSLGIEPIVAPVRGGTDGSKLSFRNLPTPNLFTGGYNFHGRHEFAVLETMVSAAELIVKISELNAKE